MNVRSVSWMECNLDWVKRQHHPFYSANSQKKKKEKTRENKRVNMCVYLGTFNHKCPQGSHDIYRIKQVYKCPPFWILRLNNRKDFPVPKTHHIVSVFEKQSLFSYQESCMADYLDVTESNKTSFSRITNFKVLNITITKTKRYYIYNTAP